MPVTLETLIAVRTSPLLSELDDQELERLSAALAENVRRVVAVSSRCTGNAVESIPTRVAQRGLPVTGSRA